MSRLPLGFVLPLLLGMGGGCSTTYLFQRTELVASRKIPGESVHGQRVSDESIELVRYADLRLSEATAASLAQSTAPLARITVRNRGFHHQVAGAIVLGAVIPMAALLGAALADHSRNGMNNQDNYVGPLVLTITGVAGLIAGSALILRGEFPD